MKRILLLFLSFLPYLASAQVAKDTVTVLTLAQIPAGAIRDTTNLTFVQDNGFNKATFDSLYKYTRVKLLAAGAITSAELANALSNKTGTGAAVFATSPALITPNLGTPSAATLTNATGLPIATGLTGLGDANRIPYATSATAMTTSANFTYNGTTLKVGAATRPNAVTTFLNIGSDVSVSNNYGAGLIHIGLNSFNSATIASHTDPAADGSFFGLMRSRGTQAAPQYCQQNDVIGSFQSQALVNISAPNYSESAAVLFEADANHSFNSVPGRIVFATVPNASVFRTERMRITSAGNVGIGVVSPSSTLHLKAGTASANTSPLKFTSGTNLTTPEAGAMEFNGTNLFFTPSTTRHTVNHGLAGSATLDFASTNAQNSRDLTITVTGASDGDVVSLGVPNGSVNANTCFTAWVSATNIVTVRFNNYSSGAVDPASGVFKVFVTK